MIYHTFCLGYSKGKRSSRSLNRKTKTCKITEDYDSCSDDMYDDDLDPLYKPSISGNICFHFLIAFVTHSENKY